jgi:hypothetical protein
MEGDVAVSREGEALSAVIPTIHGTSFGFASERIHAFCNNFDLHRSTNKM